ncbi:MAG: hypothetical protein QM496_15965 [Verrucomicrobiota bacterium]
MKTELLVIMFMQLSFQSAPSAEENRSLPFDRARINRYSLDGLPRSISIRQGQDIWLGYDLERATLQKVWRAPSGKPGLSEGFTTRSLGTTLFEDKTDDAWKLQTRKQTLPLKIRYLGCSQREKYFELSWELQHESHKFVLLERISISKASDAIKASRILRVKGLNSGDSLLLPNSAGEAWHSSENNSARSLTDEQWHLIYLP